MRTCYNIDDKKYRSRIILSDLLLRHGFLKKEIADYLGIRINLVNQLLLGRYEEGLLHRRQMSKLTNLYRRFER